MLLGAHQSISGGMHNAWTLAREDRCEAIQVFTKNKSQWRDPVRSADEIRAFKDGRAAMGSAPVLSHGSYLPNLCTADRALLEKSRASLLEEALRCEALGIDHVVFHPGAHLGAGMRAGIDRAVEQIAWVLSRTEGANVSLLVENTAGSGTCVAARFDELGAIVRGVDEIAGAQARRLGVCIDTCHAFAAGYDLATKAGFDAAWAELDREVSIARVRAMHLNDSKRPLGSRVDRHERVGEGAIGTYPFMRLVNDPALARVIGVLETPPVVRKDGREERGFAAQLRKMRKMASGRGADGHSLAAPDPPARRTRRA